MIDNCRDICEHDPRFARTYVLEMDALLEVLVEGDPTLRERAKQVVEQGAGELGMELARRGEHDIAAQGSAAFRSDPTQHRWWRLFSSVFSARDLAEPVRSFDGARDAQEVLERMCALGIELVGVRRDGEVDSFVRQADLGEGRCEDFARPLARDQIINEDASLSEVIHVLTKYSVGFVSHLGGVVGFVTRADIQKPLVRMWLFGVITMIEMTIVARIRARWSRPEWIALVPAGRLEKAQQLLDERERRGHQGDLLDCLQLSDKAQLLIQHPEELAAFDFSSKKQARRAIKEFESLRNNLAHAQDIVTHDWAQIARLTSRVEEIAGRA